MENDFEIKRLVIGFSTLTMSNNSHELPPSIQQNFQHFVNAIIFLCEKSLNLRQKKMIKNK